MTASVLLTPDQRQDLLDRYRKDPDPEVRFRAHILLLLAEGYPWATIAAMLFCSSRTIDRWKKRFEHEGIEALTGKKRGRPFRFGLGWIVLVVAWVTQRTPRDFGFLRSRWCCATVALLLHERHDLTVSPETVRRWLRRCHVVYRRPRPVVGPTDPERATKLAELRTLLAGLPADETVVWQDEVEVHSNPKIGRMWMFRGQQATVTTPGTNRKRHLSGSIHWRTGQVFLTEAAPKQGRNSKLFLRHLDDLRRKLRRYRKIHVICDNASCHTSTEVIEYLWKWEGRIEVHLLPSYSPDLNPIERVWWLLHEHITRNHRCKSLEELLELVFAWLEAESPFCVEDKEYREEKAP
jgi:putative transposase